MQEHLYEAVCADACLQRSGDVAEAIKAVLAVVYPCEMEVVCRHVQNSGKLLKRGQLP
jgi:hypothetical protein